jgi:ParB family chromosome partitioning protein
MQMIEISKLTPHPRNHEFFDDITGDKWEDFKKSIIRRGVVESIVVTQDLIIVSGHQRVYACKELGILEIPCRVTHYPEKDERTGNSKEDMILEDLISTNILQRGIGNVNPMKMAKCIAELERIYGIRQGSLGIPEPNNSVEKKQSDLANQLGISTDTLQNYKKLNDLIPELQDLVESDKLKATTAYKIYAKLSPEEQEELLNEIGKDKITKMTQKQTEEFIKQYKEREDDLLREKRQLEIKIQEQDLLKEQIRELRTELENRPTIEKEVLPKDYEDLKKKLSDSDTYYTNLKRDYDSKVQKLNELQQQIKTMTEVTPEEQYSKKLKDSAVFFCGRVNDFIEKTGGFVWLAEHINELPEFERKSYLKAIEMVENWAGAIRVNLKSYL